MKNINFAHIKYLSSYIELEESRGGMVFLLVLETSATVNTSKI